MNPSEKKLVVEYAAADVHRRTSGYSIASVIVSAGSILWFLSPVLMVGDGRKQDRIGMAIAALGIILSFAGVQKPSDSRVVARIGLFLGLIGFFITFLIPTL